MKKMSLKAAALLLAAVTVFSAGCSNNENSEPQTTSLSDISAQTTSTAATTAAATSETAITSVLPLSSVTVSTTAATTTYLSASQSSSVTSQKTTSSAINALSTTAATTAAAVTTTTGSAKATQPSNAEPTTFLSNIEAAGSLRKMIAGLGQTVLLQCDSNGKSTCYIYDLAQQSIIRELKMQNSDDEVFGVFSDGTIFATSYQKGCSLLFYPAESSVPTTVKFDAPYIPQMFVDSKNDCAYCPDESGHKLLKIDKNGSISTVLSSERIMYLESVDVDQMIVRTISYSEDSIYGTEETVFSLETGALLYSLHNTSNSYYSANNQIIQLENSYAEDNSPANLNIYDQNGQYQKTFQIPRNKMKSVEVYGNAKSSLMPVSRSNGSKTQDFSFIDLQTGKIFESGLNIKNNQINYIYPIYVKEAGCWVSAAECTVGKAKKVKLLVTKPELLKNEKNLKSEIKQENNYKPAAVSEKYRAVRNKADELEKEFHVRILVGDEVKNADSISEYNLVSAEGNVDVDTMLDNLNDLRKILAQYPKDFFSRFQLSDGSFGMRISLVDHLESVSNKYFTAAGLAYQTGAWYDIAFQSLYCYEPTMLHHEIWHNVERLYNRDHVFNTEAWDKLNPKKFQYTSDFDGYITQETDNKYLMPYAWETDIDYTKPYFVKSYSVVTPMEDRATLIEQVFTFAGNEYETITPENAVSEMNKYTHIKAKLDYLGEISKEVFGYVYWEEMLKAGYAN